MNKQELVARIAEVSGVDKKTTEHVLNVERDVIIDVLQGGEDQGTCGTCGPQSENGREDLRPREEGSEIQARLQA